MQESPNITDAETVERQRWLSILAKSSRDQLNDAWGNLSQKPSYDFLRKPDTGLIMVRGRAGGVGEKFNFGEMTMTRCSVQLEDGFVGHGFVAGRDTRHAELVAVFDAILQNPQLGTPLKSNLIPDLEASIEKRKSAAVQKADGTKVDFFTMVRGEDE